MPTKRYHIWIQEPGLQNLTRIITGSLRHAADIAVPGTWIALDDGGKPAPITRWKVVQPCSNSVQIVQLDPFDHSFKVVTDT